MPRNVKKEDLRIIKTRKALSDALLALLRRCSFNKITVHDLCAEAMVSRSAFYTHYGDKYALLRQWLADIRRDLAERSRAMPDEQFESSLCETFMRNSKVCANLLGGADGELCELLAEYLPPNIRLTARETESGQMGARHRALSDFLAGGLFSLLLRQARAKPTEPQVMATVSYVCGMVRAILDWDAARQSDET
ncbi:MAG: TetR/AcrR family transcriptional regulator [Oscillospiraceae bacterium]|nr:TetR/AcrR family transcriptional regulator [Oscillospiraceae bacterium]